MITRVDRIILTLTANPNYVGYWNFVSKVWRLKFSVIPTLVFNGTASELSSCGLSDQYGEIVRLDRVDDVTVNRQREWACTWSLFFAAANFPTSVCMTCGIDQVPLNGRFFDALRAEKARDDAYVVGFADAYSVPNRFPSSHHVARGQTVKDVYKLEDSWTTEVRKVFALRQNFDQAEDQWGLDESYSSHVLTNQLVRPVVFMRFFHPYWVSGRLDRGAHKLSQFDLSAVARGQFTEWHGDRPFAATQEQQNALFNAIPEYQW